MEKDTFFLNIFYGVGLSPQINQKVLGTRMGAGHR